MKENELQNQVLTLQAELCKSLSDPKRLRIIKELRGGERSVTELAELLGLKQSNTSQHLAIMRKVGVIVPRKVGSTVFYRLADENIASACDLVHEVIASRLRNSHHLSTLI